MNKLSDLLKITDMLLHPLVVAQAASAYDDKKLSLLGLKKDINSSQNKYRYVDTPYGRIYPDIVIYRPETHDLLSMIQGGPQGRAIRVEFIETGDVSTFRLKDWLAIIAAGVSFNLFVPKRTIEETKSLLSSNKIRPENLYTYLNQGTGNFIFEKVNL